MATQEFTLAEVQAHNTKDDLYIIVHDKVYSVASFAEEHPGGSDLLYEVAGTDATEPYDDAGHSDDAKEALDLLYIGNLKSGPSDAAAAAPEPVLTEAPSAVTEVPSTVTEAPSTVTEAPPAIIPETTVEILDPVTDVTSPAVIKEPKIEIHEKIRELSMDSKVLRPDEFLEFPLKEKSSVTHNVSVYRFSLPSPDSILGLPIGQHISIGAVLPQQDGTTKEIIRSYTPVSGDYKPGHLDLLIKTYPNGNISRHIDSLSIGQSIRVRGPKGNFNYKPNMVRHFGMIAGGTGLTPMLQIINAIHRGRASGDKTEIDFIFANVTEQDIVMKEDLDALAEYDPRFRVHYVLDKPGQGFIGGVGFVSAGMIKKWLPKPAPDVKILICGPPPMISGLKKATESLGYEKARPVSKLEDQVFAF